MTRLLIADDSPTERSLLVGLLRAGAPDITVVGEAADGAEVVELARRMRPDVVSMDLHMPRLDGIAAIRAIMAEVPTPIVLVSSAVKPGETLEAMRALEAGAVAAIPKPRGPRTPGYEQDARRLVEALRSAAGVAVGRPPPRTIPGPEPPSTRYASLTGPPPQVIGIATSTGGPAALKAVLGALPADFPVPILVVQHMAPGFVPGLAVWLRTAVRLKVKLAEAGETLCAGTIYVAPDSFHLRANAEGRVELSRAAPVDGFRPSGSVLFESLARAFGDRALGVVLTGMGCDGVSGLERLKAAGGRVVAQDEATSVVFGMPAAAIRAGVVDVVAALDDLPQILARAIGGAR